MKTPSNGPKAEAANGLQSVFTCSPRLASLTIMPRSANGGPWAARVLQDSGAKCMLPNNCRASKMQGTHPHKNHSETTMGKLATCSRSVATLNHLACTHAVRESLRLILGSWGPPGLWKEHQAPKFTYSPG